MHPVLKLYYMVAMPVQVAKDEEQQQRAARFKSVMARHQDRIQVRR